MAIVDKLAEVNKCLGAVEKINAVYIRTEDVDAVTAILAKNNSHFHITR